MVHPKNYDPDTRLYWYRKLSQHPSAEVYTLAEEYWRDVVPRLTYSLPFPAPSIVWFEAVDQAVAKVEWDNRHSKNEGPDADPLNDSCDYFRMRMVYPHIVPEPTSKVLLNVNLHDPADLLKHEAAALFLYCRRSHIHLDLVQREAVEWMCSEVQNISRFLALRAALPLPHENVGHAG